MSKVKFTSNQLAAIEFDQPENLLVSASAGSGKTEVMASRIVNLVKKGIPLKSLFISTFTVKAAAEMQIRIENKLKEALKKSISDKNIDLQIKFTEALQEIPLATIGTTDAFTNQLVKEHYQLVQIDPNFRILTDPSEQEILKQEVFDDLVEQYLEKDQEEKFSHLLKNFSDNRSIKGFQEIVDKIYTFLTATKNPMDWLNHTFLKGFKTYTKIDQIPDLQIPSIQSLLEDFYQILKENTGQFSKASQTKIQPWLDQIPFLLLDLDELRLLDFFDRLDDLFDQVKLTGSSFTSKLAKEEGIDQLFKKTLGSVKEPGQVRILYQKLKFGDLRASVHMDAFQMVKILQKFMIDFYLSYLEKKKAQSTYEFSDLIYFALNILSDPLVGQAYREHFFEIMIDEYQDSSQAQEALYNLLSNGHNLFMVGDIKQSIYGFRQADPEIFNEKYNQRASLPNQVIHLPENFRSRPEIIDFTNQVFKHLMDENIYQVAYKRRDELVYGGGEVTDRLLPEILLYQTNSDKAEDDRDEVKGEDLLVSGQIDLTAQKIIDLMNHHGVKPKEIALLVRSKTNNNAIKKAFDRLGIPVVLDEGPVNYLKSVEILLVLDILRAINNPLLDIPLVATLRSPIFSFDENDLVQISQEKGSTFWDKIQKVNSNSSQGLYQKIVSFTATFTKWRHLSISGPIHTLLWNIYQENNYFHYVGALPNGAQRQANLTALTTRSNTYENNGYRGLVKFIDMIDTFMAQNNDLEDVSTHLPQDAVRVLTIHKSKGLQFPYVFLMNIQSKFNQKDLAAPIILDKDMGIGIKYLADLKGKVDTPFPFARVRVETIPYLVHRNLKEKQTLAEEMRLLYVAMTRAVKKLYLVGKISGPDKLDTYQSAQFSEGILDDKNRKDASQGFLGWFLSLQSKHGIVPSLVAGKVDPGHLQTEMGLEKLAEEEGQVLDLSYSHELATHLPSTQTPSLVKKRAMEMFGESRPHPEIEFTLPNLDDKKKKNVDPGQVGTGLHQLMQHADFSHPSLDSLTRTLDSLNQSDLVKKWIKKDLLNKVLLLFDTPLGKMLMENLDKTFKEVPFSMLRTDPASDEQYVVRGIIDGYIQFEDHLLLFDYKTNHFNSKADIPRILDSYRDQQSLYAEALSKANHDLPVDKYLILFGGPKVLVEKL